MATQTLFIATVAIALTLILTGCSFGHKEFPFKETEEAANKQNYQLRIIQSDDFGSLWNDQTAIDTLRLVEQTSSTKNTAVVVFIHGWHHNADSQDQNLDDFKRTLEALTEKFHQQKSAEEAPTSVIGIYIGWRGRSLPWLLDYGTIWGRKSTAEQVGEGDVREFIARLQEIHRLRSQPGQKSFMGLVTAGHSLGAQVLFKAVSPILEQSLIQNSGPFVGSGIGVRSFGAPVLAPIEGIGDLVILINPALEAYQFERFSRLYRSREYDKRQQPVLLVVSSENDHARAVAFPISRWFSLPFRPAFRNDKQADLFNYALGNYEPQLTHRLEPPSKSQGVAGCHAEDDECDLSGSVRFNDAQLILMKENAPIPYSPIIVARTSSEIVDGHNGIFEPSFIGFISEYVAQIESRKLNTFVERNIEFARSLKKE